MTTFLMIFFIFVLVAIFLSLGVIFGKKTPLKGSCKSIASSKNGAISDASCSCGAQNSLCKGEARQQLDLSKSKIIEKE